MERTNNNIKTLEERIVQIENLYGGLVEQTKEVCEIIIHLRDRFVSEIEPLKSKMERTIDELMDELNNHPDFICGQLHTKRSVRKDMFSLYEGELENEEDIMKLLDVVIDQYKFQITQACLKSCHNDDLDYYWDVLNELIDVLHNNEKKYQKNGV